MIHILACDLLTYGVMKSNTDMYRLVTSNMLNVSAYNNCISYCKDKIDGIKDYRDSSWMYVPVFSLETLYLYRDTYRYDNNIRNIDTDIYSYSFNIDIYNQVKERFKNRLNVIYIIMSINVYIKIFRIYGENIRRDNRTIKEVFCDMINNCIKEKI